MITAQCQNWERDLKIKTFFQKTWSEGVRPWWLGSELPLIESGSGHWFWGTDALYLHALYQYEVRDWLETGGQDGVALPEPYREGLLELKRGWPTRRPSRSIPTSGWSWRSRPPSWWC